MLLRRASEGALIQPERAAMQLSRSGLGNAQGSVLVYGTTTLTSNNRLPIPRFPRSTSYRVPSREPGGISRTILPPRFDDSLAIADRTDAQPLALSVAARGT